MKKEIIPVAQIAQSIHVLRGQKVMLDFDLAVLYGVTTGNLNKAVKRNSERFPADFMFQLKIEEVGILKFQIGISSWGGRRALPYAFTEQGVAMFSSVLQSERAAKVNIAIMRAFVEFGEHTRLACWRWRPRHRELVLNRRTSDFGSIITRRFPASRRKEHAGRVRSPRR
jgi:hypothetical protein